MKIFKLFSHFSQKCFMNIVFTFFIVGGVLGQPENLSHVPNNDISLTSSTEYLRLAQRLNIILVIDKSASVRSQANYANVPSSRILIECVNENSGQLVITPLGESSKSEMVFYRSISDNLSRPVKERGEASQKFRKRLMEWKNSRRPKTDEDIDAFFDDPRTQKILDYSRLEGASDVLGGLDLAARYISERDEDLQFSKHKIIIICSDGQDNLDKYLPPESIDAEVYVVHRSADIGVLKPYVPNENIFTTYDGVVRHIINKIKKS